MRTIVFVCLAVVMTAAGPAEDEVSAIGEKWLALLDAQKYEDSWIQSGSMFRDQVKQEEWVAVLKRARDPLGALDARTASRVDFAKTLRGAPDGDYAIIHYKTEFKAKSVTERLTLVKEDGKWQVMAYAIH